MGGCDQRALFTTLAILLLMSIVVLTVVLTVPVTAATLTAGALPGPFMFRVAVHGMRTKLFPILGNSWLSRHSMPHTTSPYMQALVAHDTSVGTLSVPTCPITVPIGSAVKHVALLLLCSGALNGRLLLPLGTWVLVRPTVIPLMAMVEWFLVRLTYSMQLGPLCLTVLLIITVSCANMAGTLNPMMSMFVTDLGSSPIVLNVGPIGLLLNGLNLAIRTPSTTVFPSETHGRNMALSGDEYAYDSYDDYYYCW